MKFENVDAWRAHCRRAATARETDSAVLSSDWASAGITPPPAPGGHEARIPIEYADRLIREAAQLEGDEQIAKLREALAWLETPHPRSSHELLAAMRRVRERVIEELIDRD